jgi:hypothetical protein
MVRLETRGNNRVGSTTYRKSDGTLVTYFTTQQLEDMFSKGGLTPLDAQYCTTKIVHTLKTTPLYRYPPTMHH